MTKFLLKANIIPFYTHWKIATITFILRTVLGYVFDSSYYCNPFAVWEKCSGIVPQPLIHPTDFIIYFTIAPIIVTLVNVQINIKAWLFKFIYVSNLIKLNYVYYKPYVNCSFSQWHQYYSSYECSSSHNWRNQSVHYYYNASRFVHVIILSIFCW